MHVKHGLYQIIASKNKSARNEMFNKITEYNLQRNNDKY